MIGLLTIFAASALAAGDASLADSNAWLKEKISVVTFHDEKDWTWKFDSVNPQPCTLSYVSVRTRPSEKGTRRIQVTSTVKYSDIDPNKIHPVPWKNRGVDLITVHLRTGRDQILEQVQLTEKTEPDAHKDFIIIQFLDPDVAKRAAKAFVRAIELCKSEKKAEPF
ncbi:MAG: hypothetical protein HY078_04520 [Elusimicrobia bacterium]|nr:hypothetical protein [Elusimicrobiota bacterium]